MKSIYNLDTNYYNIYIKRARKGGSELDYNLGQFSIIIRTFKTIGKFQYALRKRSEQLREIRQALEEYAPLTIASKQSP
jgi:hypothetical protein